MISDVSLICQIILIGLILYKLLSAFFAKDKSKIWSPITAVSLTYIYYCIIPFWYRVNVRYSINENLYHGELFHIAALLSYVFVLIGFNTKSKPSFKSWNGLINGKNVGKYGLILFATGILGYGAVRGFHFTFAADNNAVRDLAMGGFVYYLMMTLDMLPFASGLLLVKLKKNVWQWYYLIPFWFILVDFLVAGARWRIVVMLFVLLTIHHLYGKVKRINVPLMAGLAFVVYLGFAAMDRVRMRGIGIDMSVANELKYDDIKGGAAENYSVYWFSILCMDYINKNDQFVYFEPIVTAVLMPIPRAMFPWKPDAHYMKALDELFNNGGGAAYLFFVENFLSFGWFGVIFWAWLLGWLARKFWDNYLRNRNSIAAIVALGTFSGFCYVTISRGYLAATLTTFILAICLPFWIIKLCKKFLN